MNHRSHILLSVVFLFVGFYTTAQNSVGIGTETPNPNAVLQLVSPDGNQGFLIPQLNTAQRTATTFTSSLSTSADAGLLVFDTDEALFYYWSGDTWTSLSTQQLSSGTGLSIVDGTLNNTGDLDSLNEIQDLSLSGNDLTITNNSGATTIDLSNYLDNTDSQSLSLTGTSLSISGANSVDLSGLGGSGTDDQTATEVSVTPSGNIASTNVQDALVEIQSDVDAFVDTDDQIASEVTVTSSGALTSTDVQSALEELQAEIEGVVDTDDQTLSFDGSSLSISEGNSVDISSLQDGTGTDDQTAGEVSVTTSGTLISTNVQAALEELQTEIDGIEVGEVGDDQTLTFDGSSLTISEGNSVDLSALGDDADADATNEFQTLAFDNRSYSLSLSDGNSVDLTDLLGDADETNEIQDLSLTTNTLGLSGSATTIDLGTYLDNTDAQSISLSANTLSISGNVSTVSLASYLDNTDSQTLSFTGTTLSITGGNGVNLNSLRDGTGTDDQTATEVSISPISGITGGNNVQSALAEHQADINNINLDISALQGGQNGYLLIRAEDFNPIVVEGDFDIGLQNNGNIGVFLAGGNGSPAIGTATVRLPQGARIVSVFAYIDPGTQAGTATVRFFRGQLGNASGTEIDNVVIDKPALSEPVELTGVKELSIDNSSNTYYVTVEGETTASRGNTDYTRIHAILISYTN